MKFDVRKTLLLVLTILFLQTISEASTYGIIVHQDLYNATWYNSLRDLKEDQGYQVNLFQVQDGWRAVDIRFLYNDLYGTPDYILLIGDANEEPEGSRETTNASEGNFIPYDYELIDEPYNGGQQPIANDDFYIDFYPNATIGRVPAETQQEVTNWVNKLVEHSKVTSYAAWRNKVLYATGNMDHPSNGLRGQYRDALRDSITINHMAPAGYDQIIINSSEIGENEYDSFDLLRPAAFEAEVNQGVAIINTIGVGADWSFLVNFYWTYPYTETVCNWNFNNAGMYPFLSGLSCSIGQVQREMNGQEIDTILEKLLFMDNAGIIGAMAATWITDSYGNRLFADIYYEKIADPGYKNIGQIIKDSKAELEAADPRLTWQARATQLFGDPSMALPLLRKIDGNITNNTIWQGAIIVQSDVTVQSGATLTILPGTGVFFEPGISLIVNGTLKAQGTADLPITFSAANENPAPGDWQTIYFAAGASGNSIIDHCVIEYADKAVQLIGPDYGIVISNSKIRDCASRGIFAKSTSVDIIGNEIADIGSIGLFLQYLESSTVENNKIRGFTNANYQNAYGILAHYCTDGQTVVSHNSIYDGGTYPVYSEAIRNAYSNVTYRYNDIYDADKGAQIYGSPYAIFGHNYIHNTREGVSISNGNPLFRDNYSDPRGGRNVVADNTSYAFYINSSAHPNLGILWIEPGWNDIYNNNGAGAEIRTYASNIMAEYNYWGVSAPTGADVYSGSGSVDFVLYMSSALDPFGGGAEQPGALWKGVLTPEGQLLAEARGLADQGDLAGAIVVYESLVQQYSDSPEAYVGLEEYVRVLFKADKFPNKAAYFKVMSNSPNHPLRHKARLFWMDAALVNGEYPAVVKYCEKQIKRHRGTPIEEDMYLQLGIIYLDFADDPEAAREQYDQLEARFPASEMLPLLANMINDYLGEQLLVAKPGQGAGKVQAVEILPEIYALHNAYPNPFNPSTTLRYDLPEDSRVSLTIYDIMGREVYTHAAIEGAGYRSITWQGRNRAGRALPSGIYLYRLLAVPSNGGETFVATRKMLLLK